LPFASIKGKISQEVCMRKNPWLMLLVLIFVFGTLFVFVLGSSAISLFGNRSPVKISSRNSIMRLKLEGVIVDEDRLLSALKKYRKEDDIKAFVIETNSPGGVVGPSQELNMEFRRTREEYHKPIVVVSQGLLASGAYYAAVGADKIVVAPGALVGSIGVIMEFANLERLYDWAKISRYSITTGRFKDSGAEYRPMRADERQLFQNLIDQVWGQFKQAVADGRGLKLSEVEPYADGRILTGAQAVELKFADEIGTTETAYEEAAKLAKIPVDKYEIFELPKRRPGILDFLGGTTDDDSKTNISGLQGLGQIAEKVLHTQLANQPLYMMPGAW
jgi:protease-4